MTRVLALLLVLLSASAAYSQEFKLEITPNNIPNPSADFQNVAAVFLGYDPIASDTIEYTGRPWIERRTYAGFGEIPIFEQAWLDNDKGRDLAFRDPGTADTNDWTWQRNFRADITKMDIRRKPVADSFVMKWILYVDPSNEQYDPKDKMTLSWDRNQIPSIVRHVILAYHNGEAVVDMKMANSAVIWTDSLRENGGSLNMSITLYYNQGITAGVEARTENSIRLSAYPNPAISHSKILLELDQLEYVTLSMFDVQGREVMTQSFIGDMGMNELEIDRNRLGLASGVYFVRATIGNGAEQVIKTTSIRIQ